VRIRLDLIAGILLVSTGLEMILSAVRQEIAAGEWLDYLERWGDER
jgi:hypothetical protein